MPVCTQEDSKKLIFHKISPFALILHVSTVEDSTAKTVDGLAIHSDVLRKPYFI